MTGPQKSPVHHVETADDTNLVDIAGAEAFLTSLSSALFPAGTPGQDLLTWADAVGPATAGPSGARMEDRLKSAEKRFTTLVEQIPAVTFMAVLGEGENEVYVSPHIEQMLGYSQEEWLSDPFLWYTRLHPDDRLLWNEEFTRGCHHGGPFRAECRFVARDGRIVWVHGEARLVKDERGRPQFLQGVAFDITESKRAQEIMLKDAVKSAKIEEELEIARRVQTLLLPQNPVLDGLEIAAAMFPADDVGGDYYDVRPTLDGGWITIGDVSGHGLDAGLIMLMVQSAISAITTSRGSVSPSELVTLVNEVLYENISRRLARSDYVTFSALRYTRHGKVVFAGAHQDILIRRADTNRVERVRTAGPWVGIRRHIRSIVDDASFNLHHGDVMVLFTDGVLEAANRDGQLFDVDRLCAAVEEAGDIRPAELRDQVVDKVQRWTHQQEDDITLIVARYSNR